MTHLIANPVWSWLQPLSLALMFMLRIVVSRAPTRTSWQTTVSIPTETVRVTDVHLSVLQHKRSRLCSHKVLEIVGKKQKDE